MALEATVEETINEVRAHSLEPGIHYRVLHSYLVDMMTNIADQPKENFENSIVRIIAAVTGVDFARVFKKDIMYDKDELEFHDASFISDAVPARHAEWDSLYEMAKQHSDIGVAQVGATEQITHAGRHGLIVPMYMWGEQFGSFTVGYRNTPFDNEEEVAFIKRLVNFYDTQLTNQIEQTTLVHFPEEERAAIRSNIRGSMLPRMKQVVTFVADICGSTEAAENYGSDERSGIELFQKTCDYLNVIRREIRDHGGVLDKYVGDAAMGRWEVPLDQDVTQSLLRAIQTAHSTHRKIDWLNQERLGQGKEIHPVKIVVHHGPCIVGNLGGGGVIDRTSLGPSVNQSWRFEGVSGKRMVVTSNESFGLINDHVYGTRVGEKRKDGSIAPMDFKGVADPVVVWNVDSIKDNSPNSYRFERNSVLDQDHDDLTAKTDNVIYKGLETIMPKRLSHPYEKRVAYMVDTSRRVCNLVIAMARSLDMERQDEVDLGQAALVRNRSTYRDDYQEKDLVDQVNMPIHIGEDEDDWHTCCRELDFDENPDLIGDNPIIRNYVHQSADDLNVAIIALNMKRKREPEKTYRMHEQVRDDVVDIIRYSLTGMNEEDKDFDLTEDTHFRANLLGMAFEYDALVSDRPYRPRHSIDDALKILQEKTFKDRHYAPEVYNALESVVKVQQKS